MPALSKYMCVAISINKGAPISHGPYDVDLYDRIPEFETKTI